MPHIFRERSANQMLMLCRNFQLSPFLGQKIILTATNKVGLALLAKNLLDCAEELLQVGLQLTSYEI